MESFMDEVYIESVLELGTKITMKKKIQKLENSEQKNKIEIVSLAGK